MKFTFLRYLTVSLALSLFLVSCNKEEEEVSTVPAVSLEAVSSEMNSVTFKVTSTNASDAAYVRMNNLSQVPSANTILAGGIKVSVPEEEVVLSDLNSGETFYVAAAAVSESGVYSEVQTIELSTSGENCSFELTISATTQESIVYSVVPTNENTTFYVSALEAAEYGEASDADLQAAVIAQLNELAAGASLSEILMTGEQTNNIISGLTPETEYVVSVLGISEEDATATTAIVRQTAKTLAETPELTFELSVSNITTSTAHVKVTPSDMEASYVWLCQPASNYEGLTADDADAIAEAYVAGVGALLEQGMGLYTGEYDIPDFDVMADTDYYLFAFGYTPGVGITSSCELTTFKTERGIMPEDLEASINITLTTAKSVTFDVVPIATHESIYYLCTILPDSAYTEQAAIDDVEKIILDHYEMQIDFNPTYSMADAVSSVCYRGEETGFQFLGLTPETDYTLAVVSITNEGKGAKVITTNVTTKPDIVSGATFTNELFGIFDGNEAQAAGLFTGSNIKDKALAVFTFERSEEAVECYYYMANGDYSNPEEEFKTDDELLSWITTNPYFTLVEEDASQNVAIPVEFYDNYSYLGYYMTLMSVAKDANGTWGPICRTLFLPEYAKRNDIQELVDLMNSDSAQNIIIVAQ